jgi:hypothetical protein
MSNKHKTAARKMQASAIQKAVINILADHADESGYSFPSIKTIALGTCLGETSVMTAIGELEEEGVLVVEREAGEVNKYYLQLGEIEARVKSGVATKDLERRRGKRAEAALARAAARDGRPALGGGGDSRPKIVAAANADGWTSVGDGDLPAIGGPRERSMWRALIAAGQPAPELLRQLFETAVKEYTDSPRELFRALLLMLISGRVDKLPPREDMSRLQIQWLRRNDDGSTKPLFGT